MLFQYISHYSFQEDEECEGEQTALSHSNCGSKPIAKAVVEVDSACGFVLEVLYQSDQVGIDVVQVHGSPQSCMPNPVKCLLGINEDMIDVLLMLVMPLTEQPQVEDLFICAPSWSETCLFFSNDVFCLWFQSLNRIFSMTLL